MSKPVVLFLCTGNSARSQMGEALLRHAAGDRFDVHSAGTRPKGVHPLTVQVLQEAGVDTAGLRSKPLTEYLGRLPVRYLIVVCDGADRDCPTAWLGVVERMFWPFPDPSAVEGDDAARLSAFRTVRDAIADRIGTWCDGKRDLKSDATPPAPPS
ncbi:MAG: arsenate reductase ArsC [Planctomycetaceae bacterium]|nr:arsenate reductase ArsC [Planctomycetaceae bacterium]